MNRTDIVLAKKLARSSNELFAFEDTKKPRHIYRIEGKWGYRIKERFILQKSEEITSYIEAKKMLSEKFKQSGIVLDVWLTHFERSFTNKPNERKAIPFYSPHHISLKDNFDCWFSTLDLNAFIPPYYLKSCKEVLEQLENEVLKNREENKKQLFSACKRYRREEKVFLLDEEGKFIRFHEMNDDLVKQLIENEKLLFLCRKVKSENITKVQQIAHERKEAFLEDILEEYFGIVSKTNDEKNKAIEEAQQIAKKIISITSKPMNKGTVYGLIFDTLPETYKHYFPHEKSLFEKEIWKTIFKKWNGQGNKPKISAHEMEKLKEQLKELE